MNPLVLATVVLSALYCVIVSIAVTARMDRSTQPFVRWPVLLLGTAAAWAILRTVSGSWCPGALAVTHAAVVVAGAAILAMTPRIQT